MSNKYGRQIDDYARRTGERAEHELDAHIDHDVHHGTAGDAVRGADGHSPDSLWESEPVHADLAAVQRGRQVESDLRGAAKDARSGDQSTTRNQNTKR
jgi:hypothetical protein